MNFLLDTLKSASLHVHAVWLAIAYIAVIVAMAVLISLYTFWMLK